MPRRSERMLSFFIKSVNNAYLCRTVAKSHRHVGASTMHTPRGDDDGDGDGLPVGPPHLAMRDSGTCPVAFRLGSDAGTSLG